jgi:hypothetical protein
VERDPGSKKRCTLSIKSFLVRLCAEVGQQSFVKSTQIANPQILGFIPLSEILKFLTCAGAGQQIANPQIFLINSKILIPQISKNATQLCLKTVQKVLFLKDFFVMSFYKFIRHLQVFADLQIIKKICFANRKSAKCQIC